MTKLGQDLNAAMRNDPAARNKLEVILTYSGFHALFWHRIAHFFYKTLRLKLLARIISQLTKFFTGIEIHPGAKIAGGVFIDHGAGVVIGETSEIGTNVTIYQGVTLGGTGKDKGKRHPTIGNNVMISAGAKVLGGFRVGDNAKIGAGSVVLSEVPAGATVVGIPGKIVRINGQKVNDLDQSFPDPLISEFASVSEEIDRLYERIYYLENAFMYLEDELKKKGEETQQRQAKDTSQGTKKKKSKQPKAEVHPNMIIYPEVSIDDFYSGSNLFKDQFEAMQTENEQRTDFSQGADEDANIDKDEAPIADSREDVTDKAENREDESITIQKPDSQPSKQGTSKQGTSKKGVRKTKKK